MSFGIDIRNNNGAYLLSSELSQYGFIGKYSLSPMVVNVAAWGKDQQPLPSAWWTHKTIWYCDIHTSERPVCAISIPHRASGWNFSAPAMGIHGMRQISTGVWRLFVLATAGWTPPSNCVYAFASMSSLGPSSDQFGLRIMNSSGGVTFDSGRKPLVGAPGTAVSSLFVTPAYIPAGAYDAASHWFWGFESRYYPITPNCGTFVTGNAALIGNFAFGEPRYGILYPLFTYTGTAVKVVWTPVFMFYPWNHYQSFHTDGTYWYTAFSGSQSGIYDQKVIVIDSSRY